MKFKDKKNWTIIIPGNCDPCFIVRDWNLIMSYHVSFYFILTNNFLTLILFMAVNIIVGPNNIPQNLKSNHKYSYLSHRKNVSNVNET